MMITEVGPIGPALAILAVVGVIISYVLLRREMRSEMAKLRQMVEAQPAEGRQSTQFVTREPKPAEAALPSAPKKPKQQAAPVVAPAREEITPDILAVISAAVAHFVGAGARIRSTRLLATPGGSSSWAQQGRVIIQASHNLGAR